MSVGAEKRLMAPKLRESRRLSARYDNRIRFDLISR